MPKISALPAMVAGDLTTADLLPVVDSTGPTTRKTTIDIFRIDFLAGAGMTATPINGVTTIHATGAVTFDTTLLVTGIATFTAIPVFSGGFTVTTGTSVITAGGLRVSAGNIAIGSAVNAAIALLVNGSITAGVSQTGVYSAPTFTSSGTTAGQVFYAQLITAAAAFTMVSGYGLYIDTPFKGAGSAITTAYGIMVKAQTQGTTNNYGIYVEAPSGGATNNTAIIATTGNIGLHITGTSTGAAVTKYAVSANMIWDTSTSTQGISFYSAGTATGTMTSMFGVRIGDTTSAAAFTLTNRYGVYIDNVAKGAGSTITNDYGLYVVGPTQGGTINRGIYVGAGGVEITAGNLGIGTVPATTAMVYLNGTTTVGVAQTGINLAATASSAATTSYMALSIGVTTAAAGFTCSNFYGIYVDAVAKGAGSTITNRYGLYIVNPTDGGTLNRAVFISGAAAIVDNQGVYTALSGTAVPATAGAVAAGAPITLYSGLVTIEVTSNAPTHTRAKGSICLHTGGLSTSTRMYVNTDGAGTWASFTTSA